MRESGIEIMWVDYRDYNFKSWKMEELLFLLEIFYELWFHKF